MVTLQLGGLTGPAGADPYRVAGITLQVHAGEVVAVIGPSGAGKTTLLRLIAGLEPLAAGTVHLGDQRLDVLPPAQRRLGLVTAEGALQPHLDVAGNIELPLRLRRVDAGERRRRVAAEAGVHRLRRLLRRRPRALSAGERQATALARETVRLPAVMLLDEPMARLDAAERVRVRRELATYLRALGAPTLLATNDHTEAMALGDRLAVLDQGRLVQLGAPQHVYDEPATTFVAAFLGEPGANLVPGRVEVGARTVQVRVGDGAWAIEPSTGPVRARDGSSVTVGVRPEHLWLERGSTPPGVPVTVARRERLGARTLVHVDVVGAERARVVLDRDATAEPAEDAAPLRLRTTSNRIALFDPASGARCC